MHDLLALPARLGGIASTNPTSVATLQQSLEYPDDVVNEQVEAADSLKQFLSASLLRSMDLAHEKGSSVWLPSLPVEEFCVALHKRVLQDALALCYNWQPLQAPSAVCRLPTFVA